MHSQGGVLEMWARKICYNYLYILKVSDSNHQIVTLWPSGLRRQLQVLVRKSVGSNPTGVILLSLRAMPFLAQ